MFTPVILAGGSGSRLWPLSRKSAPKQFLDLNGLGSTMLQQTISRISSIHHSTPVIVANQAHRFLVAEQMRELDVDCHILLEPFARSTAPAVALAALTTLKEDPILLVLSADHHFADTDELTTKIRQAVELAEQGYLVTFGITPSRPETGYGYICKGTSITQDSWQIECFVEKPNHQSAQKYLDSGRYLWNSGMFMFRASVFLDELKQHAPSMYSACCDAHDNLVRDMDFERIPPDIFSNCPDDSIDYAVMEKTRAAVTIELDAGWSDIGSWEALWDITKKDEHGNCIQGDVVTLDTANSLISSHGRLVATLGVSDLAIVETRDAVLVAHKSRSQEVKKIVTQLERDNRSEHQNHSHVARPWGGFDTIDLGKRYQVKRITVKPGQRLSLQMHYHRAEHWVVVSGTALVVCGEREMILTENQSTFIPVGVKHRLSNPGSIPLELIEVQSGDYLGEDDIVRFDDIYGRAVSGSS